tara:strand:- start:336 stop:848 length:513 start_codon:yes stop_codon:yes gene_type:complete
MRPGNKKLILTLLFSLFYSFSSFSEDKILSSPLINLNELKPSFEEEINDTTNDLTNTNSIKKKKKQIPQNNLSTAEFIGLDKITAKTSTITINLGETLNYGPLEIKVLKCGEIITNNKKDNVAYLQVKDLSENENEKIFIFNGWTFSSDPSLIPFDHAIYDLQLVSCSNV